MCIFKPKIIDFIDKIFLTGNFHSILHQNGDIFAQVISISLNIRLTLKYHFKLFSRELTRLEKLNFYYNDDEKIKVIK